jgi:restriction endonuclease S subunit
MTHLPFDGSRSPVSLGRFPQGWSLVRLDGFSRVTHGGTPSKDNPSFWVGDIPWVSPKDMRSATIGDASDHISEEAVRDTATNLASPGSILAVVRSGILVRTAPIAVTSDRVAFNQDIKSIEPDPAKADVWFLYWVLKAYEPVILSAGVKKGATVHSIRSGFLESLQIPIPPLDEQRRMANIIGAQMAAVERAQAAAEAQLEAAEALPAAHLKEMFERPDVLTWPRRRLGDLMRLRKEVVHPRERPKGRANFVGLEHIVTGSGARVGSASVEMAELTGRKPRFYEGDIVYGYLRPYLNKVWIAEFDGLCSVDQYVYAVDPNEADTRFISAFMRSQMYLTRAPVQVTPGQLPRIRTEEVASVWINLPSMVEQQRLVGELEERMAVAERMIKVADEQVAAVNALPAALLRRAFSGEL